MTNKRGLFVVLEGIDGSGTSTQTNLLHDYIKSLSKHNDVLTTHEPWDSEEIDRILREEKDAYSGGLEMLNLFVGKDRKPHQEKVIIPNLNQGVHVLSDRFSLSTYAYQGVQKVSKLDIDEAHTKSGIVRPDLTLFLDVPYEVARERIFNRKDPIEKFEGNEDFTRKLIEKYDELVNMATIDKELFGKIAYIDGRPNRELVARNIRNEFDSVYRKWQSS